MKQVLPNNGGILPYFYNEDTQEYHFLLGKEDRTISVEYASAVARPLTCKVWTDFGGVLELDDEARYNVYPVFKACTRELYEELHVIPIFLSDNSEKYILPYIIGKEYIVFLLRIDQISLDLIDNYFLYKIQQDGSSMFKAFSRNQRKEKSFNEKEGYRWFSKDDIEKSITNTKKYLLNPLGEKAKCCINENGILTSKITVRTELYPQLNSIKESIKVANKDLLFYEFIPYFDHDKVDSKLYHQPSIVTFMHDETLKKQPIVKLHKWFTTIYCMFYTSTTIDNNKQYSLFSFQADEKGNVTYFYPIKADFDTTQQFIDLFLQLNDKMTLINDLPRNATDKKSVEHFLNNIDFQINVFSQTAYCAIKLSTDQLTVRVSDELYNSQHAADHAKYQGYFCAQHQILNLSLLSLEAIKCTSVDQNNTDYTKQQKSKDVDKTQILPHAINNKASSNQPNQIKQNSFLKQLLHYFAQYRFSLMSASSIGFLLLLYYYYR